MRTWQAWDRIERRIVPMQRLHGGQQLPTHGGGQAAAHLARMPQLAIRIDRHDERAQVSVAPLAREPAGNDQLLLTTQLDLEPIA